MKEFSCTITNPAGIDTRRAGLIVKIAKNYDNTVVTITKGGTTAKTSQLMKLIGLGIKQGDTISVAVEGSSEDAAAAAMEQFFKMKKFTYTITNPTGIDTWRAGLLGKLAKSYPDTMITITKGGDTVKTGQGVL